MATLLALEFPFPFSSRRKGSERGRRQRGIKKLAKNDTLSLNERRDTALKPISGTALTEIILCLLIIFLLLTSYFSDFTSITSLLFLVVVAIIFPISIHWEYTK